MNTLNNLPLDNSETRNLLIKLNEDIQKDPELAHYLLQWIVDYGIKNYQELRKMCDYVEMHKQIKYNKKRQL